MPEFDPTIFKAYDIRGIYPDQLDDQTGYLIGNALAVYLKPEQVVIGRDMRLSSEALFDAFTRGVTDAGVDVVDIGLVSTDGLYFAVGKYGYDAGVMITASHNPKEYNGFKICKNEAIPLSGRDGLNLIADLAAQNDPKIRPERGAVVRRDISADYTENCLSYVHSDALRNYKVAFDAGNGMAGLTLPPILARINLESIHLYFELDGTFPNHPASPIEPENIADLIAKIKETGADFGVAFDGDADRMFLVDNQGRALGGDMVMAMVAQKLLADHPGETILYNAICSRAVPELISRLGGTPVRTPVGHALIKPMMREKNAIFGGEHSGHFYFRDNWFADSGMIAFLVCLELLSKSGKTLSQIISEIDPYFRSGEINSEVSDQREVIERISRSYDDGKQDRLDGLTVEYDNWWFNVRPSNTEPLLRLNVEADTREILKEKTDALLGLIRG
ncbi:MAG: phosphomannomutase/phosphoglucomutase [candidate division Zixibacteria bacterium]|nr:phosphomannomutase/phosphoglucomutase [candidate division Zixibacteria bacterium]